MYCMSMLNVNYRYHHHKQQCQIYPLLPDNSFMNVGVGRMVSVCMWLMACLYRPLQHPNCCVQQISVIICHFSIAFYGLKHYRPWYSYQPHQKQSTFTILMPSFLQFYIVDRKQLACTLGYSRSATHTPTLNFSELHPFINFILSYPETW